MKYTDLTGKTFGRLSVSDENYLNGKKRMWLCKCECGNEKYIKAESLKNGRTNSCGCLYDETRGSSNKKHGLWASSLYWVFSMMKRRCFAKTDRSYKHYGGRGITICQEWLDDFKSFYDWSMANGYKIGLDIDRIENNGNYSPDNCRWTTRKVNQNNRRVSLRVEYNGKLCTMDELELMHGIPAQRISHRIKINKWPIERAISEPVQKKPSGYKQKRKIKIFS